MDAEAMEPFGRALLAHLAGRADAELVVRRDDGTEAALLAGCFFREPTEFTPIERAATQLCRGRVLDVGCGAGSVSLFLERSGYRVTAVDISPQAVAVGERRGLKDVRCADVLELRAGPFDTLLLLGHGIGMVETLAGLDRFLGHARSLLSAGGQLLLDSLDVRVTDDPRNLAYHEANRKAGRYVGEVRMQFEFEGLKGPFCGWLQVDADTLAEHAERAGWRSRVVHRDPKGDYLARLTAGDSEQFTQGRE